MRLSIACLFEILAAPHNKENPHKLSTNVAGTMRGS
jgi:hypothetical protein